MEHRWGRRKQCKILFLSGYREEEPLEDQPYWYLGMSRLSIPWWTEVIKWAHREGVERVDAPMLFTAIEGAGEQLRALHGDAADNYLRLVEQHGEEEVNEAYDNTPPTKVFEVDKWMLLDYLEDSDFLCLMVG
jgi:hypothetical protein